MQNGLTAVEVSTHDGTPEIGKAQPLFTAEALILVRVYDVSADGQRFVVNRPPEDTSVPVKFVTNWEKALKR